MFRRSLPICAALFALLLAAPAVALAAPDPAASQIESFDRALVTAMKGGASIGIRGRARLITPAIDEVFAVPLMTQFAVGPTWPTMTSVQHANLTEAFRKLAVANFAHNFSGGSARFDVDPNVVTRGLDKLVQCKIVPEHGDAAHVVYRMRQVDGRWQVIDVFYNGSISELTTKRSDFAATLKTGGPDALVAHMNAQADKLMR